MARATAMNLECPNCQEPVKPGRSCICGWRAPEAQSASKLDPNHGLCAWLYPDGCRCTRKGVVTPSLGESEGTTSGHGSKAKWYCGWHFECVMRGHADDSPNGEHFRDFHDAETRYAAQFPRDRCDCVDWNSANEGQVRGLAFLGPESLAWRKSPVWMQEAAAKLLKGGWKAKGPLANAMQGRPDPQREAIRDRSLLEDQRREESADDYARRMIDKFNQSHDHNIEVPF